MERLDDVGASSSPRGAQTRVLHWSSGGPQERRGAGSAVDSRRHERSL